MKIQISRPKVCRSVLNFKNRQNKTKTRKLRISGKFENSDISEKWLNAKIVNDNFYEKMAQNMPEERFSIFADELTGEPYEFVVDIDNIESRQKIINAIKKHGGTVQGSSSPDQSRISIIDPETRKVYKREDGDFFSYKFILDSVTQGEMPESLVPYRVNFRSMYEDYEPMDVLLKHLKWSELRKKLSMIVREQSEEIQEVSDIEDDNVMVEVQQVQPRSPVKSKASQGSKDPKVPDKPASTGNSGSFERIRVSRNIKAAVQETALEAAAKKKVSAWLSKSAPRTIDNPPAPSIASSFRSLNTTSNGFNPYTKREEESIVRDIVENRAYNYLKGNHYWKECEDRGVACKGNRTWQSMKERFRKKIAPTIHTFNLTDQEYDYFRKCLQGIPVDIDDTSSDDGVDSEAETEIMEEPAKSNTVPSSVRSNTKSATPKSSEKSSRAQSTPKKGDKEIVDTELEVTAINVPRSSPRLAERKASPDLLEEVPKKRHKLWSQVIFGHRFTFVDHVDFEILLIFVNNHRYILPICRILLII